MQRPAGFLKPQKTRDFGLPAKLDPQDLAGDGISGLRHDATISGLAVGIERETDGTRALSLEAEAAWSYWSLWDPVVEPTARPSHKQDEEATLAGRRVAHKLRASDRKALRNWYAENLQPRLSRMHPTEVAVGTAMGRSYAYYVVAGTRIPHPRHFPSLAGLVGVELPKEFAAALCSREG